MRFACSACLLVGLICLPGVSRADLDPCEVAKLIPEGTAPADHTGTSVDISGDELIERNKKASAGLDCLADYHYNTT